MSSIIQIESEGLELKKQLEVVKIDSQETYDAAVEARVAAKDWTKKATEFFDGLIKPAYVAYKNLLDNKKKVIEPVDQHIATINKALVDWDDEQEKLRRQEQERLAAEARKKEEEERLLQAIALEESGADKATIASLIEAPATFVPAPVAAPTYTASKAVIMRDHWTAEVTDLHALVKAVAKDKSKLNLLSPNMPALNSLAKALKDTMVVPGVRAVNNRIAASGRG